MTSIFTRSAAQLALSLTLGPLVVQAQTAETLTLRKATECSPRNGLPNFFAKAASGKEVKVAYLGGSITAQPGYRVKTLAHFKSEFPQTQFTEINAAIGGTGSDLGVFRIEHDVFQGNPDLLFVEFAVNDGGAKPADIVKAMEGIVRKTWKHFPSCDICFVYTFTEALLPDLKAGNFNRSASTMESVADHYGIPSIHMGLEAVRLETEGKLVMKAAEAKMDRVSGDELNKAAPIAVGADGKIAFSQDGVHPYLDTGHRLYTEAVIRSLPAIQKAASDAKSRILATPLDPLNYENTAMVPLDKATKTGPWTQLPTDTGLGKNFGNRLGQLWKGAPGAELVFRFKGSAAKMYDLVGPDCGKLEITIDGTTSSRQRFDSYCTYHRLATTSVASALDETAIHEVKIRVLPDVIDKEKILFEKNREDLAKNPAKYAETNWYAGAVFLIGELLP
ncbi:MAG: GDSL-type esterase/lipase family protein [Verrucomicrobiota bacterium]